MISLMRPTLLSEREFSIVCMMIPIVLIRIEYGLKESHFSMNDYQL